MKGSLEGINVNSHLSSSRIERLDDASESNSETRSDIRMNCNFPKESIKASISKTENSMPISRDRCSINSNAIDYEQRGHSMQAIHYPRSTIVNQSRTGSEFNGVQYPAAVPRVDQANANALRNAQLSREEYLSGISRQSNTARNGRDAMGKMDSMSLRYEAAFKKPLILKDNCFFDDDLAAFKDESSPNVMSTNASSLSSLTIDDDDDDYEDVATPSGEHLADRAKAQRTVLRHLQRNLTGYDNGKSSPNQEFSSANLTRSDSTRQTSVHRDTFNNYQNAREYSWQGQAQVDMHPKTNVLADIQRNVIESSDNRFFCNDGRKFYAQEHERIEHEKYPGVEDEKMKFRNTYDWKSEKVTNCRQIRQIEPLAKHGNAYQADENNDTIGVYEEQLLDQCIRRGMAKVTKRSIGDIKPFSWDLNHICLTTRAMLIKTSDDDILRRRNSQCNQRFFMPKATNFVNSKTR